jgi:enamine deaminase RidA (YjgF/YER057c/UK114 family)
MRKRVSAKTPWGDVVGYSRAVKVGNFVTVSGTAAADKDGKVMGRGDAYEQTLFCIRKIESALKELGCSLSDVVRTRIFTTDIRRWQDIGKAHGKFFGKIKPATSMIEVKGLIDPDMLVEIEADAILE